MTERINNGRKDFGANTPKVQNTDLDKNNLFPALEPKSSLQLFGVVPETFQNSQLTQSISV